MAEYELHEHLFIFRKIAAAIILGGMFIFACIIVAIWRLSKKLGLKHG